MQRPVRFSLLLFTTLSVAACTDRRPLAVAPVAEPPIALHNVNAGLYQNASAEVAWLFEQGYAFARVKLDANLAEGGELPPAVIVDVDETVLDNSPYEMGMLALGQSYSDSTWKAWTARADAPPVPGALAFLRHATDRGCAVFYITNRHLDEKEATITNLQKHGFPMADAAHVLPMDSTSDKTARRAGVARDHRIVLLVGDQLTDLDQALKDRSKELGLPAMYAMSDELSRYFILLPNASYGYWRDAITGRGNEADKRRRTREFIKQRAPR